MPWLLRKLGRNGLSSQKINQNSFFHSFTFNSLCFFRFCPSIYPEFFFDFFSEFFVIFFVKISSFFRQFFRDFFPSTFPWFFHDFFPPIFRQFFSGFFRQFFRQFFREFFPSIFPQIFSVNFSWIINVKIFFPILSLIYQHFSTYPDYFYFLLRDFVKLSIRIHQSRTNSF